MTKEEKKRKAMEREYAWREKYPERYKARMRKHYVANRDKILARSLKWVADNKERHELNQSSWRKLVSVKRCADAVSRRAVSSMATPKWANEFFITEAYHLARLRTKLKTGGVSKWHVDHIVPLKSKLVCGLHVHNNLRVIPAIENLKKRNSHIP